MSITALNSTFYNIIFDKIQLFGKKTKIKDNLPAIVDTNNIQTLVITNANPNDTATTQQLQKILDACKLSTQNTAIIHDAPAWTTIKNELNNLENILLFGITENELGITGNWIQNRVIQFDNKNWIKTIGVETLQNNNNFKLDLWNNALKTLFVK